MKNLHYLIALPLAGSMFFTSCTGKDEKEEGTEMIDTVPKVETNVNTPVSETFFQVPSPGEMLTFIKMVGKDSRDVSFLNPPDNYKNYNDTKSKALNFGVYSCDLSYCSIFGMGSESLKYFKAVKTMGDQIGVSTAIKPEVLKRLEANLGKPDSLAVITDDVYFSSFDALEDSKQGPTLALVVGGGWLESLYIATRLAKYEPNSPVIERLADQKYTLENLIEFLKKHESDPNVAAIKSDFEGLLAEYNKMTEKDVAGDAKKDKNSKATLIGGGKQLVMTKEIYDAIVAKIQTIRNSYTLTK